ncbi:hypothetical protein Hbl1158_09170 [Halobaculum sp. CBA1158]|uniref:hypothetical protein n=1 Tax=Halobaculum sp. CBA1158 TaxID=2904243 RepID=UPI001F2B5DB9|nr:hypothetical protein [Halobaculum sp. CBA1158]UIO98718.1 hypothetical protein Hbl1158_09170 [Halobaculum sp. CBA1158]
MGEPPTPDAPVWTVQTAAIEHALTVGESPRALALAGALDPLRSGVASRDSAAGDPDRRAPAMTALSTALSALIGIHVREAAAESTDGSVAGDPVSASSPRPEVPELAVVDPDAVHRGQAATRRPAVVGAAVAVERFGVAPERAATLAECSRDAVEGAVADRSATADVSDDPQDLE